MRMRMCVCVCVCVCVRTTFEDYIDLHETWYIYCNGSDQRTARQRLRKHVPTPNSGSCVSVDEWYSSLLGSSQRANELAG
jgi:hypothetical protein